MVKAVIHCNQIDWQKQYANYFESGFGKHNIDVKRSSRDHPEANVINVVFANNSWKRTVAYCQAHPDVAPLITVNRCFFGSRHDMVAIGWDGFNGDADFCLEDVEDDSRWNKHGFDIPDWKERDGYILVCGEFRNTTPIKNWYKELRRVLPNENVRFRPHPFVTDLYGWEQAPGKRQDDIETALAGASVCISYDSIAGCDAVLAGVPSITYGPRSMAYDVSMKTYEEWIDGPTLLDRKDWCSRLAYCQWSHQEIKDGDFWEHLKGRT